MTTQLPPDLSSRTRRIAAIVIDHFLLTFLAVSIIFFALGSGFIDDNDTSRMMSIMLSVLIPLFLLYFAKDSMRGISVGRWIMGIMVRDANNPDVIPSFGKLFVRNLFLIIWPVEFIVLALNKEKKRLGDQIVHTVVVKNPNKPTKVPRILALLGVGLAAFAFIFFFSIAAMKNSDAYRLAISEIEQNADIIKETGGIKGYGMMPTGGVNIMNGIGSANFEITVIGREKDLDVFVRLTKEPNDDWHLVEMKP